MQVGSWTLESLVERGRTGALYTARDAGGRRVCIRVIEAAVLADAAARDRILATVQRVAVVEDPGLVPVLDLVAAGDAWYLVCDRAAGPVLRQLLDSGVRAGSAAALAVLRDAGRGAAALAAQGLAHGALSAPAVLLGADATARLAEAGLLAAMTGTPLDAAVDRRGWAELARTLRHAWIDDDRVGVAVERAAEQASSLRDGSGDLGAALRELERAAHLLPAERSSRVGLQAAVVAAMAGVAPAPPAGATLLHGQQPATPVAPAAGATMLGQPPAAAAPLPPQGATLLHRQPPATPATPPAGATMVGQPPAAAAPIPPRGATLLHGQAPATPATPPAGATMVGRPPAAAPSSPVPPEGATLLHRQPPSTPAPPAAPPAGGTMLAQPPTPPTPPAEPGGPAFRLGSQPPPPSPPVPQPVSRVHFGEGPSGPAGAGSVLLRADTEPALPAIAHTTRRRRGNPWLFAGLGAIGAVVVAGAIAGALHRGSTTALTISGLQVTAAPHSAGCDTTVHVSAVLRTNGGSGTVDYQWLRDTRPEGDVQHQPVSGGQVQVTLPDHLYPLTGHGIFRANVALQILSPSRAIANDQFTYECSP